MPPIEHQRDLTLADPDCLDQTFTACWFAVILSPSGWVQARLRCPFKPLERTPHRVIERTP